jgi:hypothetical protein
MCSALLLVVMLRLLFVLGLANQPDVTAIFRVAGSSRGSELLPRGL